MTRERVNEIDLLRFFAAIAVTLFHYTFKGYAYQNQSIIPYPQLAPFTQYGHYGVELFFMISGFVILMTAAQGNLRSFVVSRFVRLYPAFWACCTLTFLITLAIGEPRYTVTISQYLVNMTMMSEFVGVSSIDGSYWSLFVEMRFYGWVALILAMGRIQQAQLILAAWLIVSVALEFFPSYRLSRFLIAGSSAYFIAGAAFFLVWSQGVSLGKTLIILFSYSLALFQAINGLSSFEKSFSTTVNSFVIISIISSFFLIMLLISLRRTGFFGRCRWQLAGALTYPLYLLHQNIGYMIFNRAYQSMNSYLILWSTMLIILGLGWAVHSLVEKKYSLAIKNVINIFFDSIKHLMLRYKIL